MKIGQHARLVAGVVVGLVVAGGTAFATTSDSSGTETAACITPSKYIRILPEDAECRSREVAISLPSMDTIAAIEGVVNENSDAFDAFLADNEEALTEMADLVNANGADIFTLQGDLAAEVENRVAADEDLTAAFDNYYTSEDIDAFLLGVSDAADASSASNDENFSALAEQLGEISDVLVTFDSTLSTLDTRLTDAQAGVDGLAASTDEQLGAVDARLDAAEAGATAAAGRLDAAEAGIAALADSINTGLSAAVADVAGTVASLTAGLADANAAIATLSGDVAGLTAYINSLEARIAALEAAHNN